MRISTEDTQEFEDTIIPDHTIFSEVTIIPEDKIRPNTNPTSKSDRLAQCLPTTAIAPVTDKARVDLC